MKFEVLLLPWTPDMTYFKETEKLFIKPTFLEIATRAYVGFIQLDEVGHWQEIYPFDSFELNEQSWKMVCSNTTNTRDFSGYRAPFRVFAGDNFKKIVFQDWTNFKKEVENPDNKKNNCLISDFLNEAEVVKERIEKFSYLEPIKKWLVEGLESILEHYESSNIKSKKMKTNDDAVAKMNWNGQINVLNTIFFDLMHKKLPNNKGVYLDALPEQVAHFLSLCFTHKGNEISINTVMTNLDPNKPEDRDTKKKIVLDEYFEHE